LESSAAATFAESVSILQDGGEIDWDTWRINVNVTEVGIYPRVIGTLTLRETTCLPHETQGMHASIREVSGAAR
jgi:hypothetical protein